MFCREVYHLELVSRDAKEHCFCSIVGSRFTWHFWAAERNHTLSWTWFFDYSQTYSSVCWQPRQRRDWPRCRRSPRLPWFVSVPRIFWHLPLSLDLTVLDHCSCIRSWVFWCQLTMTSVRPVYLTNDYIETPGLGAGATPLVRAHHCKGKRGYFTDWMWSIDF